MKTAHRLAHVTGIRVNQPLALVPASDSRESAQVGAAAGNNPSASYWDFSLLSIIGAGLGAYHGTKRNRGDVRWGAAWGVAGAFFPIITNVIGFAQGYAKPIR